MEFVKKSSRTIQEKFLKRSVDFQLGSVYYDDYKNNQPLKSLNFIIPFFKKKKYLIVREKPPMATYILWKYDGQWDEAEQKRIQYFMAAAMRRGYNKFILQMVFIKNPLKYKVGTVHMEIIFQLLKKEIKEFLQKVPDGNSILLKNELIMDSEVKEVTNVYGGFFLIATTVNNDHWVGA
jgi:hypothetical protein